MPENDDEPEACPFLIRGFPRKSSVLRTAGAMNVKGVWLLFVIPAHADGVNGIFYAHQIKICMMSGGKAN